MDHPREEWHSNPNAPNNGPQTNITIWAFTSVATVFIGLRIACKYKRKTALWFDDWILMLSWVPLITSCIIISVNINAGFGKHDRDIDPQELDIIGLRNVVAGSLYFLSSAWSKTSFAISLLRVAGPRLRILIWVLLVSMNVFMHAGVVINWATCRPIKKLWMRSTEGECWPAHIVLPVGIFFSAYSGLMDITLALLPWKIILGLQMNLKEKIGVAAAMSTGLFAGVTAIIKSFSMAVLDSRDFNYVGVGLIDLCYAEVATTIIAASVPILRTLVRDLTWPSCRILSRRGGLGGRYFRSASVNGDGVNSNGPPLDDVRTDTVGGLSGPGDQSKLGTGSGLISRVNSDGATFHAATFDDVRVLSLEEVLTRCDGRARGETSAYEMERTTTDRQCKLLV